MTQGDKTPTKHPWYFRVLAIILILAVIEGISYISIWVLNTYGGRDIRRVSTIFNEQTERIRRFLDPGTKKLERYDRNLGWTYIPGFHSDRHRISDQGLRSDREYSPTPLPGVRRIAAFGDSFVYGNEVANGQNWAARLETLMPATEVLNFGVGGYGTDQAFLRYQRDGRQFQPQVVLIGWVPDDIRRNVNVYRRFLSDRELALFKPRFRLDPGGQPILLPNPVHNLNGYRTIEQHPRSVLKMGPEDFWYEPLIYDDPLYDYSASVRLFSRLWTRFYRKVMDPNRLVVNDVLNTDSTAYRLQCVLLQDFAAKVSQDGATPVVLLFPDRGVVAAVHNGKPPVYQPLKDFLDHNNIPNLDLLDAFLSAGTGSSENWFAEGGHYSPEGNRVVATWLSQRLADRTPVDTSSTRIARNGRNGL